MRQHVFRVILTTPETTLVRHAPFGSIAWLFGTFDALRKKLYRRVPYRLPTAKQWKVESHRVSKSGNALAAKAAAAW